MRPAPDFAPSASIAAPGADATPPAIPDPRVAAILRGSVGCAHAALADLSSEERRGCQDKLAGLGRGPVAAAPLGLRPGVKEAFDLAVMENNSAHMPAVGCFARFGLGQFVWYHPSRGVKLGPLPCYYVAPKAVFLPNKPPAKGF